MQDGGVVAPEDGQSGMAAVDGASLAEDGQTEHSPGSQLYPMQ